ncbi:putative zinc-type alcohol dehydrogenase-like protein [Rhizopus microsporus ATCC 52813]|uniref:Putative zinc-type alcohol dehydrogenase-like protein n=1 Tax=Rhizopus microsporus ATCC 52813 TaxID=1340429 RepID=A0A2G4SMN9_RHIZD|nr:putative zinc-type alcohol dehydrogenase-like protein [Rhizopus microsporus ATCC 52813]PHZ10033.1 putative zinc-type alcohol dehydrogenase-like protein [Rhizopus microsporus ATCC 52813]
MATNVAANLAQKNMGEVPVKVANEDKQRTSDTEMLACCWVGKRKLELRKVPKPEITDDEDVIIKVTGSTVCGSDLHLYHGELMQLKEGEVLGHECIGVVEKIGPKVTKVKPGDRVITAFNIACGKCDYCAQKLYTSCESANNSSVMEKLYGQRISGVLGYSHFLGGFSGAQAEYCRILFGNTNVLKVPDNIKDEQAIYLSDIIPTSYHAVYDAGCKEGEVVGVWGLGPIGLNACQWLRNVFKAKRIIAIDNVPARLQIAKERWGVETINFDKETDVVSKILELEPKGLDRAIDCAGFRYTKSLLHKVERAVGLEADSSEVLNEAIRSTKKFGTVALIADYAAYSNHVLIGAIMEKGIRLVGCGQAPIQGYWDTCLDHISKGEFDPIAILTHRFKLDDIVEVYRRFDAKEDSMMKVFIETKFSSPPMPGTPSLSHINNA